MNTVHFMLLMAAIYVAPNIPDGVRLAIGGMFLLLAIGIFAFGGA